MSAYENLRKEISTSRTVITLKSVLESMIAVLKDGSTREKLYFAETVVAADCSSCQHLQLLLYVTHTLPPRLKV